MDKSVAHHSPAAQTSRRTLLKAGLSTLALSGGIVAQSRSAIAGTGRPPHFLLIFLRGGFDPVYTTDPKRRSDVAPNVDVPYEPNKIIDAKGLRLGPHFAALAPFAGRMAILNGVQVHTANHQTGALQVSRLRTQVTPDMPGLLDIVAQYRESQPVGCVSLGDLREVDATTDMFADPHAPGTLFPLIDRASPSDLGLLSSTMRLQAEQLLREGGQRTGPLATTVANIRQAADLFDRVRSIPPFRPVPWSEDATQQGDSVVILQRTLWLFEHDLTKSVYMKVNDWDSHIRNTMLQGMYSNRFMPMLARFLREAEQRIEPFGNAPRRHTTHLDE